MALLYKDGAQSHVWPADRTKGFSREEIETLLGGNIMRWPINHPVGNNLFIECESQLERQGFNQSISEITKCPIFGPALICTAKEWREARKMKVFTQTPKGPGFRTIPSLGELVERELDDDLKNMFRKDRGMAPVILGVQACRNTRHQVINMEAPKVHVLLPKVKKKRAK